MKDESLSLTFFEIIVVYLDTEDDAAARRGNEIGEEESPQNIGLVQQSLQHKCKSAHCHHQEGRQSDAISIARTDGLDSLRQVTQYHSNAGHPPANQESHALLHKT